MEVHMRGLFAIILCLTLSISAYAIEAPTGQIPVTPGQVLRGQFVQVSPMKGSPTPVQSNGHFIVAPGYGLIWNMEKPFPTSTIITPKGSVQDLGGIAIKLPIKNLDHLYRMVGGALTGDWDALAADYTITTTQNGDHWQMVLTPRGTGKPTLSYQAITVSGRHFVENIILAKADGTADTFAFSGETLAKAPLAADEVAAFNEVIP
jgi:hypothetical protein